jgi:hypothetical protein
MGSKNSRPPPAPDPYATASAQTQSNIETATANSYLNNVSQYGPRGSITYEQTGTRTITRPDGTTAEVPIWAQHETLSEGQQALSNQQEQIGRNLNQLALDQVGRLATLFGQPANADGLPAIRSSFDGGGPMQTSFDRGGPIQTSVDLQRSVNPANAPTEFGRTAGNVQYSLPTDFSAMGRQAQDAIMARLRPELERSQDRLDNQLANQGIERGSSAWWNAQAQEMARNNDANSQAVLSGFNLENQLYNQALAGGQFHNAAQAQDYGQQLGRGQFAQAGIGQNNEGALAAANFYNTAALNAGNFANGAQNQQFGQNQALANFNNVAQNQQFNQNAAQAQFNNQAAQQILQQTLALRNQPLNEISALMSGGQVSLPQFQGYNPAQVQSTPIGQYVYNTSGIEQQQYQQQQQNQNAMLAGLFGLGSAGLFGLAGGGLTRRT